MLAFCKSGPTGQQSVEQNSAEPLVTPGCVRTLEVTQAKYAEQHTYGFLSCIAQPEIF